MSRIMIVDDNPMNLRLMDDLFGLLGHDVQTFTDASTALRAAESFQPTVALIDIHMRGMNGIQLVQALRAIPSFQSRPLFALTAAPPDDIADHIGPDGFTGLIRKPPKLADLSKLVESHA